MYLKRVDEKSKETRNKRIPILIVKNRMSASFVSCSRILPAAIGVGEVKVNI